MATEITRDLVRNIRHAAGRLWNATAKAYGYNETEIARMAALSESTVRKLTRWTVPNQTPAHEGEVVETSTLFCISKALRVDMDDLVRMMPEAFAAAYPMESRPVSWLRRWAIKRAQAKRARRALAARKQHARIAAQEGA